MAIMGEGMPCFRYCIISGTMLHVFGYQSNLEHILLCLEKPIYAWKNHGIFSIKMWEYPVTIFPVQLLLVHSEAVTYSTSTQLVGTQLCATLRPALPNCQLSMTWQVIKWLGTKGQKMCHNSSAEINKCQWGRCKFNYILHLQ